MPRWAAILLCLALFTVVMLAVRAGLHTAVPVLDAALVAALGRRGSTALVFGGLAALGVWLLFAVRRQGSAPRI